MIKNWLNADWPAPDNVRAGITLRNGGVSQGCYQSLNLADHVEDRIEDVKVNRRITLDFLGLPSEPKWLRQVHGNRVVRGEHVDSQTADASFSNKKNLVCAVLTADCLPLLLCSQDGEYVAAVHCGWRGLLAGIIENTLRNLPSANFMAWMGPAIGPECFEVGPEVQEAFVNNKTDFVMAFNKNTNGSWYADIYQMARIILMANGIDRIYGGNYCTVTDAERFYSYRRDGKTGRMATLIWKTE